VLYQIEITHARPRQAARLALSEGVVMIHDPLRSRDALCALNAGCDRDEWVRIGMAAKAAGVAEQDWLDWCETGVNFGGERDAKSVWRSIDPKGGITAATLFHMAQQTGWRDPVETNHNGRQAARAPSPKPKAQETPQALARDLTSTFESYPPASADHPYITAKRGWPDGVREVPADDPLTINGQRVAGWLAVPVRTLDGALQTIQYISGEGKKLNAPGAPFDDGLFVVGEIVPDGSIYVCEGIGQAWTCAKADYHAAAVVAFGSRRFRTVAKVLREHYPAARIVMVPDKGKEADAAVVAREVVGQWIELLADRPANYDVNDYEVEHDNDALVDLLCAVHEPASEEGSEQEPADPSRDAGDYEPTDAAATAAPEQETDDLIFPGPDERPCWRVYEGWHQIEGRTIRPGVYWYGVKPERNGEPTLIDKWVCTPLRVIAVTRNREDAEYGRLLEIMSPAGKWKKWSMPMSMLAGDGIEARAVLLNEGHYFDLNDKSGVLRYIASQVPKDTMRAASVTGWHDGAFVLPHEVIGADDIWFQASGRTAPYASAGTFEGWRELAGLASGNPLMMLAMSAALAGPLLGPLNIDGGGLNLFGDTSVGKTTVLQSAISVWGGPEFKRTWRATANGLEGAGALHTDTLLALDELGEIDPKSLYESAYALINGQGKTRANRYGEARPATRWRVFLLSTGEMTIAARMAAGNLDAKAGQELRILDIPVAGSYGLFDDLHRRVSGGVLADDVRNLAAKHYGHAGPRFVTELVRERRDGLHLADLLDPIVERFGASDGQERRAARIFAVCALAGELSVRWGVTPWEPGASTQAAIHAFKLWRDRRSTNGQSAEHVAILHAVADFIDKHGDSRFSNIAGDLTSPNSPMIRDRAGYWKNDVVDAKARRLYLFTPGGLREATKGFDIARVTAALDQAGALADTDTGKRSKTTKTPDGRATRLYYIDPAKFTEGE
jgi:putative DNA primase/helicase